MPMGVQRDGRWLDVTVSRPKDKDLLMIPVWLTWLDERKEQREGAWCARTPTRGSAVNAKSMRRN